MISHRLNHTDEKKNIHYSGIELKVSKEDFIEWFMALDFEGCSVDRIDKHGHYELSNMQVISLSDNIAKDKLIAKDGVCTCYSCKETKPIDQFAADKRRKHTGKSTICRECDNSREKTETKEAKERRLASMRAYYHRNKEISVQP